MADSWRHIPGYPDLEVSDSLRFRTVERTVAYVRPSGTVSHRTFPSKELKVHYPDGYGVVFVSRLRRPIGVHVLVCLAWHGLPPEGKPLALHADGQRSNNTPGNLRWGDHRDNAADAAAHGTLAVGSRHGSKTQPHAFAGKPKKEKPAKHGGYTLSKTKKLGPQEVAFILKNCVPNDPKLGFKAIARELGCNPTSVRYRFTHAN